MYSPCRRETFQDLLPADRNLGGRLSLAEEVRAHAEPGGGATSTELPEVTAMNIIYQAFIKGLNVRILENLLRLSFSPKTSPNPICSGLPRPDDGKATFQAGSGAAIGTSLQQELAINQIKERASLPQFALALQNGGLQFRLRTSSCRGV